MKEAIRRGEENNGRMAALEMTVVEDSAPAGSSEGPSDESL